MPLNCLVFEKIAFLYFGDRQTDEQTNRWTGPLHEAALAVASGGLIIEDCTRRFVLKLTTDRHEASYGLLATAELYLYATPQ